MKYRSRSLGQCACMKGMSRTITIQGFIVTAITDAEKTKTSTLMSNFDVNVDGQDGRTVGRTHGRTEIWTPISHPAISRCDKNIQPELASNPDRRGGNQASQARGLKVRTS